MVRICNEKYSSNSKYDSYFELYPYPLSDFQKYAIEGIVEGNHVLVTAHTGSGKTLPAEFAINHFVSQGKKVIYTSPIKALSNQKYYEFTQKYPHISFGLFTGDIKTNPNADVLIMTTEILMNYLFNTIGSKNSEDGNGQLQTLQFQMDIERELACVVFDEVHYINDAHRGQNWEQTILMLPRHVQMIMLSATIDSPERFAKWCERGYSDKEVILASTNHRVVPLTHYAYLTTTEGILKGLKDKVLEKQIRDSTNKLIKLKSENGKFEDTGYNEVKKLLDVFQKKQVFMKRQFVLNNLAQFLRDRDMLPGIVFIFSRKNVERCAHEITVPLLEDDSKIPYTVKREAEQIVRRLPNFNEYLNLPEYKDLISLLEKGIGIHHSGMIPILREIVELFISKKYIKLLFATESFAIGLDCPIKTAVFIGLNKFDGNNDRILMSHEYTQMAGRAGRRGIDKIGNVVHCNNLFCLPSLNEYKSILCGNPQKLVSKFHISYSMILNLLKQKASISDVCNFVEKSMIFEEINKSIAATKNDIIVLQNEIGLQKIRVELSKTPNEVTNRYLEVCSLLTMSANKKKKTLEKEKLDIIRDYPMCEKDSITYKAFLDMKKRVENEELNLKYLESFIPTQVGKLCNMMEEYRFIKKGESGEYELDSLGIISSNIAEVHPLVMAFFMEKWNYFSEFTPLQLIGLFSCFTDIKIPQDYRRDFPGGKDLFLKSKIEEMVAMFSQLDTLEGERDMRTGINYESPMVFDIIDEAMEWCNCKNEEDCKKFINTQLFNKEISIGDFTKAVLKISIISKELMAVCELIGQVDLLYKLTQIDSMILIYITVNQSLYV